MTSHSRWFWRVSCIVGTRPFGWLEVWVLLGVSCSCVVYRVEIFLVTNTSYKRWRLSRSRWGTLVDWAVSFEEICTLSWDFWRILIRYWIVVRVPHYHFTNTLKLLDSHVVTWRSICLKRRVPSTTELRWGQKIGQNTCRCRRGG